MIKYANSPKTSRTPHHLISSRNLIQDHLRVSSLNLRCFSSLSKLSVQEGEEELNLLSFLCCFRITGLQNATRSTLLSLYFQPFFNRWFISIHSVSLEQRTSTGSGAVTSSVTGRLKGEIQYKTRWEEKGLEEILIHNCNQILPA